MYFIEIVHFFFLFHNINLQDKLNFEDISTFCFKIVAIFGVLAIAHPDTLFELWK